MPKLNYITVPETDLSLGIDARSAENQIGPSFVRDLLNADIVEKRVRKRSGYQGYAGNLPFRVTKLEYKQATSEVCFTLDSAVSLQTSLSLETVRSSPIVVYGRSSEFTSGQGPFTDTDSVKYYSEFTVPTRKQFVAPSGTLNIPGTEHGLPSTNLFVDVVESLSTTDRSYQQVDSDAIRISESSLDVNIDYTTYVDRDVFVIFSDETTETGSSYVFPALATPVGTHTISIPAATHNLSNFNILLQMQQDTGTERVRVRPDSVTLDTSGNVIVTVTNGTGSSQDYYILLSATETSSMVSGSIGAGSTGSITIPNATRPWIFYSVYLEQTPGGTKELVIPDSISYDDGTQDVTISFTNDNSTATNFFVYYQYGAIRSNQLCVTDLSVTVTGTDDIPQLSIWGLEHSELYLSKSDREAWVSHIDAYRRSGEQRLISGLGGNLFSARTYSEVGTTYAYPLLYPNLLNRTSSALVLGPLFWDSSEAPGRSRGYVSSTDAALHWARVTSVAFNSGTGFTDYTLTLPGKQVLDSSGSPTTLGSVISTSTNLEDWVTIQGMSNSKHSGTFRIAAVQDGVDEITLSVDNPNLDNSDYDDSETGGEGGIYTDQIQFLTNSTFIPGDSLSSGSIGPSLDPTVLSSSGMTVVADGFVDKLEVGAGVLYNGGRTSSLIPLRSPNPSSSSSVLNLVRGDMLTYLNTDSNWDDRLLRVLAINADSDRTVDISVGANIATVTMLSGDNGFLTVGGKILLLQAGQYTGVQTITALPTETTIQFSTEETGSFSGATLAGNTAQIDEELEWADSAGDTNGFLGNERWIPIEAPDDSFSLTPNTHTRYFDTSSYVDQPFLRSTMVQDNMYLSNYSDEVYKFDGTNMYRAGLIAWQPGAFLSQETSGAAIVADLISLAYSAKPASPTNGLTISATDANSLPAGTPVRPTGSTETYTVVGYSSDGTTIFFDRALDSSVSASGTVKEIGTFRYYYRLNAVDANSNIIASAVTGYQDHVMELTQNAAIQHKLVGLPVWDVYDYDRLECEIYRTKKNQAAPFYKVTTQPMSFDNTTGYINYKDSFADSDLTDLDIVNTALKGAELGVSWSDSLRARYVTSIGNRAVLANVSDYPQLDFQIVAPASILDSDFAGDSILFRRDNTDPGTSTDMLDRVRYQWVSGFTGTASGHTIGTNQFTFTTSSAHGASVGDWVYLTYATVATTGRNLTYSGWWQIASAPTSTSLTVNLTGATAAATYPNRYVVATDPTDVPVLLGVDGNLGMVNGDSFDLFDSMRRLSMAINASMRQTDITVSGMELFTPWLVARGGNDSGRAGRLIVRQPRADDSTFEAVPTFSGYDLFVNSVKRLTGDQISASTRIYPSRIIVSYENYPEIFDNPTSILDADSDSAIDINSADGQEITGVIPFFGEAAFGAAQQSSILVVFKTNSIYLVDINSKVQGLSAVQRIETEGLGCTAPYSIAVTKSGITFANESGIYCLRRNQAIQYIGRYMERNWTERADLDALSMAHGHHYGIGRAYKLSVPILGTESGSYIEPSEVYVYNHTGEDEGGNLGAWGRYDNHPAIGWANLNSDAFYASTDGRVFSVRVAGTETDFRDDNGPVNMLLETRPNDFGNAGIRKVTDRIVIHYRSGADSVGTTVGYAQDLEQEYTPVTPPKISQPTTSNGTSDTIGRDITSIMHTLGRRRGIYLSISVGNDTLDESIEVAGIDFQVGGLQTKGILEAASSTTSR